MPMTPQEIAKLPPGAELLVRCNIGSPVAGNGDIVMNCRFARFTIPYTAIEGVAPAVWRVGDVTTQGQIVAIAGAKAWINDGTADKPECFTHFLKDLKRAPPPVLRGALDSYAWLERSPNECFATYRKPL